MRINLSAIRLANFMAMLLVMTAFTEGSLAWQGTQPIQDAARDEEITARFKENTTQTARVKPTGLAAKAGTAIAWQSDLRKAIESSKLSGKPVFWYVPTLSKTFMDRKNVIDQYMMAGPFSWPAIAALINENFEPVKYVPNSSTAASFGIANYKFIEPGFVIITDGQVKQSVDRLTTLHPRWLFQLMSRTVANPKNWDELSGSPNRGPIEQAWSSFTARQPIASDLKVPSEDEMELKLLRGMELFRSGKHAQAIASWEAAAKQHPNHPLAWKAAHEAQGIGPFVRGFEVFLPLNAKQQLSGIESAGSAAPSGTFSEAELWNLSAQYLLDMQRDDGGFFDSDYDFGGMDSMPNVHLAVTAICGWALHRAEKQVDPKLSQQVATAVDKAAKYCSNDRNLNAKDRDEILWAEAYRLRFLSTLVDAKRAGIKIEEISRIAKRLEDLQAGSGTWFHEYPNSFVTATALIALKHASQAGVTTDKQRVDFGLKRLDNQRYSNGAYPYDVRRGNANRSEPVQASSGRIPLCSYARFLWGECDDSDLSQAAEIGLKYHELLAKAVKYDNHTDTYAFGGFFFWYDMHARSEAIAAVQDQAKRKALAARQLEFILGLPELDGCFVDSHELGRCYGTASAMLCLDLMQSAIKGK